jgi:predicted RNase H-like HicB family nuclease
MQILEYTAVIEFDTGAQRYVGHVPAVRGAVTEAATLEELRVNLEEVVQLMLDVMEEQGDLPGEDSVVGLEKLAIRR